jgi:hypothetical protein
MAYSELTISGDDDMNSGLIFSRDVMNSGLTISGDDMNSGLIFSGDDTNSVGLTFSGGCHEKGLGNVA